MTVLQVPGADLQANQSRGFYFELLKQKIEYGNSLTKLYITAFVVYVGMLGGILNLVFAKDGIADQARTILLFCAFLISTFGLVVPFLGASVKNKILGDIDELTAKAEISFTHDRLQSLFYACAVSWVFSVITVVGSGYLFVARVTGGLALLP